MSNDARKPALLVVHTNTYFTNLLPVARLLQRSTRYAPMFWFVSDYPTLDLDRETCRREGFPVRGRESLPAAWSPRVDYWLGRTVAPLKEAAELVRTRRAVRRMINELAIRLVVFPADNRYDIAVYVRAAHDEGVPVAVLPAFMAATREWAEAMSAQPSYGVERNRLAAWLYPQWVHDHNGKQMVALPSAQLFARQWLGLAPPRPWTLHSGHADAIALESLAIQRYCISEGLPAERLIVTGSADHDRMAERLADRGARDELTHRLGIDPALRLLVTALPPDQLYGAGRKSCEFQRYDELVETWIGTLSGLAGWHTVVSLHPSVKRETMLHLERRGVTIATDAVSALIPVCDLYVASVSATIQWAIACGKPVINYDVYRYRYPDYLGVDGIVAMEEREAFVAAIARITGDPLAHAALAANQQRVAADWGVLDGRAGQRLTELFDRLTARRVVD